MKVLFWSAVFCEIPQPMVCFLKYSFVCLSSAILLQARSEQRRSVVREVARSEAVNMFNILNARHDNSARYVVL